MRKSVFTLAPAIMLLLAGSSVSYAGSNAQMTITASIVAATCDVSVSTSSLDLGNHSGASFIKIGTPLAESQKSFTVGLNNCQSSSKAGDTGNVIVSGATLGGNPNIFNSSGSESGIMLSLAGAPAGTYISAGDKLNIATAGTTPSASDFNAKTISLRAGVASTKASPEPGNILAPILFSFAYN